MQPAQTDLIRKVKNALLSMQRHSWEQGVAAQAFLEMGDGEMAILMAKEAASRQLADGRLAVMGNASAVTDSAAVGEALLFAAKATGDPLLEDAAERMVDWLLRRAPRTADGVLYHLHDRPQVWVDSLFMAPPFLCAAGHHEEALRQIHGMRALLWDPESKLMSPVWDDGLKRLTRRAFWGVGNGWALAGMTRVIAALPPAFAAQKAELVGHVREGMDACLSRMREDGLFHDVIDDPSTFVETNLSQMLSYVLYRGMAAGWMDASHERPAEKMRRAAEARVDSFGLVQGVCGSPHFDRPGTAAEGQAFFLLMEAAARGYFEGPLPG